MRDYDEVAVGNVSLLLFFLFVGILFLFAERKGENAQDMSLKNVGSSQACGSEVRVVIAEDEPLAVMNLTEVLTANGYRVVGAAEDGFAAIDLCKKHHPDVVLLDIHMPELDGLTAAKYIYKEQLGETVIILSAYSDDEFVRQAGDYGVSGYLVKPVDDKTLLSTIKVARARSKELLDLQDSVRKITKDMESRKKIERAKGVLMRQQKMSEDEAYTRIRVIGRERNMSMETVADIILCSATD